MKKFLFVFAALLLGTGLGAQEFDTMKIVEGDTQWAKNAPRVRYTWDYENAIEVQWTKGFDNTVVCGRYIETCDPEVTARALRKFDTDMAPASRFYKKKGFIQIVADPEAEIDYEIHCQIDTIDTGNAAAAMWLGGGALQSLEKEKRGGMIASGTVTIKDGKTGEKVCVIEMNRLRGVGGGFGMLSQRYEGLYYNMLIVYGIYDFDPLKFKPMKRK